MEDLGRSIRTLVHAMDYVANVSLVILLGPNNGASPIPVGTQLRALFGLQIIEIQQQHLLKPGTRDTLCNNVKELGIEVDKLCSVSAMYAYPWSTVEAEMAKCDIVCAVCHRLRTEYRRKGLGE